MPTPEALLEAWNRRKESKERMIVLGGMLHDLECYVDNCLKIDENGRGVGRRKVERRGLPPTTPSRLFAYAISTVTLKKCILDWVRVKTSVQSLSPSPALAGVL